MVCVRFIFHWKLELLSFTPQPSPSSLLSLLSSRNECMRAAVCVCVCVSHFVHIFTWFLLHWLSCLCVSVWVLAVLFETHGSLSQSVFYSMLSMFSLIPRSWPKKMLRSTKIRRCDVCRFYVAICFFFNRFFCPFS